jgi:hypothetical protein
LPLDKAPGPDGSTTHFLQSPWSVIKLYIMATFDTFWYVDACNFQEANTMLMVLLSKSPNAVALKDYRLIFLIHTIGKLVSKVLANCLAPRLDELVHASQSAFIKGRFIQDNFRFVQAATKLVHSRKQPSQLIKVDITRAFDFMS